MSTEQSADDAANVHESGEDVHQDWIEQVEHEETIAPEAVNEEEVEEYIEVDGIVDEHEAEESVLMHGNTIVVPTTLRNGAEIFYAHVPTVASEVNLNLPDLLSRAITFTNGSKMYLCFSKKCRKQLAFDGHLYNIDGFVKPASWNFWRCANPLCKGAIRTSPNITELRVREPHSSACIPDDVQIRLRITIYDLRLMAEFTDVPLGALYHAYLEKVATEHSDIVNLFPTFPALKSNLEDHRANVIYRRRFALEARESDTNTMYYESFGAAAPKFKKTKPFPPSLCMSCSGEFRSTPEVPSQDFLLEHMFFDHNRKTAVISRFTFEEPGLFEQWVRELQFHSKYKLKKMGIHDEHMYYLCQNDDRHYKSNHGRSTLVDMHCTAFIRVHDWRLIIRREVSEVSVDYCLDHFYHSEQADPLEACKLLADLFTPEVFMRELVARRERTQQLIQDTGLQRVKRRAQQPSLKLNPSTTARRDDGDLHDRSSQSHYYEASGEQSSQSDKWVTNHESVFGSAKALQRQKCEFEAVQQIMEAAPASAEDTPRNYTKESYAQSYITKRENFTDAETYNSVLQFEISCDMMKERMQYARNVRTANHYLGRLTRIIDDMMADPQCAPSRSTANLNVKTVQSSSVEVTAGPSVSSPSTARDDDDPSPPPRSHFSSLKREAKAEADESLPLRQKVLVRKGENGELVVVRRTILGKVRKVVRDDDDRPVADEPTPEEVSPSKPTTSQEPERLTRSNTTPVAGVANRASGDGPPIGDLLRDALYRYKREPRYDRRLLQGVRRMAYQNLTEQSSQYADDEMRFLRKYTVGAASTEKLDGAVVVRRGRGRPRKYP
ncbi:hypothetical protein Y032_0011g1311 [Ancylostoma ceylanicum]|uniref:FLYWCH-type domain-containing protein n=1 Tax=Ancylostoma ceylanicum TaxID=53326 RepID=A0A016VF49_9BILA|nr:hypothetical protein Y032_0011g1311 [Ancylostoma ceylanicum]